MQERCYILILSADLLGLDVIQSAMRPLLSPNVEYRTCNVVTEACDIARSNRNNIKALFIADHIDVKLFQMEFPEIPVIDSGEINSNTGVSGYNEAPAGRFSFEPYYGMIGVSKHHAQTKNVIEKVAKSNASCLILGESGTGKELVARAIHMESERSANPFIPVNSGAIPSELIESELFGYEKGTFTGAHQSRPGLVEIANGGTLFLDEITETPVQFQTKLLRFLQEKTSRRLGSDRQQHLDVRVIAATNRNPHDLIASGVFREDLYYRLNVVEINLVPIKNRKIDILLLLKHYLDYFATTEYRVVKCMAPEVLINLLYYQWPGNIRELRNMVHRMVLLADSDCIELTDIPVEITSVTGKIPLPAANPEEEIKNRSVDLRSIEKEAIIEAISMTGGNKDSAAKLLGIGRATIYRKIKEYGIQQYGSQY